jgi:KDO2-lipid IV(A) lauroyltransferase
MRTIETANKTDWIVDRTLRGGIRMALALPYPTRVSWFGKFVERGVSPVAGYVQRAENQLALIWPDMSAAQYRDLARACCNNFGRTIIENYSGVDFARQIENATVSGDGLGPLAEAKATRRPVLFVTGHFGNHEAPRLALTQRGYSIGGLYRPIANPYVNAHYEKSMLSMSGAVFAQGRKGTMAFVRMLRDGGMGTLLFDVRATAFPKIPFLGHDAHTATSAADIALKVGALVIPYFGIRRPDGLCFDVAVEAPIQASNSAQMMAEMTARLESHIYANPDQWFWIHRRWG